MIEISVQADIKAATRWLDDVQRKQIPFATSVALNKTASDVQNALVSEMRVFDRPKPVTKRGVYVVKSTKTKLTAVIGLKSRSSGAAPVAEYLAPNIAGTRRMDKRSETLLKQAGVIPHGKQTRPGPDARLDQYGNMSRGQIVQIISYFRAFGGIKSSGRGRPYETQSEMLNAPAKRKRTGVSLFVTPIGIWERKGRNTKLIVTFTEPQAYSKKYDFDRVARTAAERQFDANFRQALGNALATAR